MAKSESQTRREIIDALLSKAGWNPSDPAFVSLEFDIELPAAPSATDPMTAEPPHVYTAKPPDVPPMAGRPVGAKRGGAKRAGAKLAGVRPGAAKAGHRFVDYLLLGRDGRPLAVVEAKRTSKDAELGREQAKQYAHDLAAAHGGRIPFVFYTNGFELYFWGMLRCPPRKAYVPDA